MGVSVGTNGVSVYEHADNYMPAVLVWQSPVPLTDWTHIAIVYTNGKPSLYINGVFKHTGVQSGKGTVYPGMHFPGGYTSAEGNLLDEMRIWKVTRTAAEIQADMNGEIPGSTPGLVGYWPMNEGSGGVLHDLSGNGRDISLNSSYSNSIWVAGRYSVESGNSYRYAFNGKELDKDISEDDYDYGMRISDSRLGRFLSVDPLKQQYPWYTPYQFAGNKPIWAIDLDGLEEATVTNSTRSDGTPTIKVSYVYPNDRKNVPGIGLGGFDYPEGPKGSPVRHEELRQFSPEKYYWETLKSDYYKEDPAGTIHNDYKNKNYTLIKNASFKEAWGQYTSLPKTTDLGYGNIRHGWTILSSFQVFIPKQTSIFYNNNKSGFNEADINPQLGAFKDKKSDLDNIGAMMQKNNSYHLLITGYTDKDADDKYNQVLSKNRVEAIAKYLKQNFKISSDRITLEYKGESQSNQGKKKDEDRKVDITLTEPN